MWLTKSISVIPSELHVNSHVSQSFHACYYVLKYKDANYNEKDTMPLEINLKITYYILK